MLEKIGSSFVVFHLCKQLLRCLYSQSVLDFFSFFPPTYTLSPSNTSALQFALKPKMASSL